MNHNIDHTEKAQKQTVQFMSNGPKIYMLLNREPKQEMDWKEQNDESVVDSQASAPIYFFLLLFCAEKIGCQLFKSIFIRYYQN